MVGNSSCGKGLTEYQNKIMAFCEILKLILAVEFTAKCCMIVGGMIHFCEILYLLND